MSPTAHALYLEVASSLRELARDPRTTWSYGDPIGSDGLSHAEEEMLADNIDYIDIVRVIQNGKITDAEDFGDERRYTVEGISDGRPLVFIVTFSIDERLIEIITTWANN